MAQLADVLAGKFSQLFPEKSAVIEANRRHVQKEIAGSRKRVAEMLRPVKSRTFAVLHDAYQYFEKAYGLANIGAFLDLPGQSGSLHQARKFAARLKKAGAVCLFVEPQFSDRLARAVINGSKVRIAVLDPLGATLQPGPDLFLKLGENLADGMRKCLLPDGAP